MNIPANFAEANSRLEDTAKRFPLFADRLAAGLTGSPLGIDRALFRAGAAIALCTWRAGRWAREREYFPDFI